MSDPSQRKLDASERALEAQRQLRRATERLAAESYTTVHSRSKANLCHQILLDHFGPLVARVARVMLQRGRVSMRELVRFLALQEPADASAVAPRAGPSRSQPLRPRGSHTDWRGGEWDDDGGGATGGTSSGGGGGGTGVATRRTPRRLVQQALLVLIQHNLAWHARLDSSGLALLDGAGDGNGGGGGGGGGTEYFLCDQEAILARTRFGRYMGLAEQHWGQEGRDVVHLIFEHGKLKAGDIIEQLGENDANKKHAISTKLAAMLYRHYLRPSVASQYVSPRDREISLEEALKKRRRTVLTPKDLKEIRAEVAAKIDEERRAEWEYERTMPGQCDRRGLRFRKQINGSGAPSKGRKGRSAVGATNAKQPTKKQKLTNGKSKAAASSSLPLVDDEGERDEAPEDLEIEPDVFLRVNVERFDVHLRDELIYKATESRYNRETADVLCQINAIAQASSEATPSAFDATSGPVMLNTLASQFPSSVSLRGGFDRRALRHGSRAGGGGNGSSEGPSRFELLAEYVGVLCRVDDPNTAAAAAAASSSLVASSSSSSNRPQAVNFLGSGAHEGESFSTTISAGGSRVPQTVHVCYAHACGALKRTLLRHVVDAEFGRDGVRILGLLMERGKLDEKQIAKVVLLSMPTTRDLCARMFKHSLLSLQEVPKSSDRNPIRTFFLWHVDEAKVRAWLLERLYSMQARLATRRRDESARRSSLLAKARRSDVASDLTLLSARERAELQRLDETTKLLALAEARCDMDHFLLSHLPG